MAKNMLVKAPNKVVIVYASTVHIEIVNYALFDLYTQQKNTVRNTCVLHRFTCVFEKHRWKHTSMGVFSKCV